MEITSDIILRGTAWNKAIESLGTIFKTRTNYSLYILALSIGIMYDKRIEKPDENGEEYKPSVPRNVIQNNDGGKLEFMFQASILTTRTENLTEDERLELAFGEKTNFKKIDFLTQFANFGVTKLVECIGITPLESMENLKNFLFSIEKEKNFDIEPLIEEISISEYN